jgi:DNA (cytosine-5)-methyltransferase 1
MLKIATVFSGIGAIEHAIDRLNIPHEIVFACDNGERILKQEREEIEALLAGKNFEERKKIVDELYLATNKPNFVEKSYLGNYELDKRHFHQDVRFVDGKDYAGCVDLFVGGSPCQSFSISGKRLGLEDARGTLFYEYARLVKEIKPKVFIYENVPGMLSHDNGNTWKVISSIFDQLGYNWNLYKLSAKDYGIPQNRTRIYVVGFRNDLEKLPPAQIPKVELKKFVQDYLDKAVDEKYYHGEKGFKWITKPKSLEKRVNINEKISRTQAANQQFNWCGDMVFEKFDPKKSYSERIYVGTFKGEKGVARKLTPRECLRLMGYDDSFKILVPDQQMYRQSGNSIVVNVLEAIMKEIIKTEIF